MVSSELARKIGYRSFAEVGASCDSDFGIRFCAAAKEVWYLDEFVADYRISNQSVGASNLLAPHTYKAVQAVTVPQEAQSLRNLRLAATGSGCCVWICSPWPYTRRMECLSLGQLSARNPVEFERALSSFADFCFSL